jgi:hypothetical protein
MEVTRDGIIFKWEEIRDVLPSDLQDGWRIRQILGNDARRTFDVGVDRIEIQTTRDDIAVYVMPYGFSRPSSDTPLSAAVALCEEVIRRAKEAGVFDEFILAMQVLNEIDAYIRKRVREEIDRALADFKFKLETLLKQNEKR